MLFTTGLDFAAISVVYSIQCKDCVQSIETIHLEKGIFKHG